MAWPTATHRGGAFAKVLRVSSDQVEVKYAAIILALAAGCNHGGANRPKNANVTSRSQLSAGSSAAVAAAPVASTIVLSTHGVAVATDSAQHARWRSTVAQVISPDCNGNASRPSRHRVVVKGQAVQQECGLVAAEFGSSDYERFVSQSCNESLASVSLECTERWYDSFIRRVLARYTAASWRVFPEWCESHPTECDDLPRTEQWFLSSHSSNLYAAYNAALHVAD
jgi:hypothetical protein